jgi:hypothetical protein
MKPLQSNRVPEYATPGLEISTARRSLRKRIGSSVAMNARLFHQVHLKYLGKIIVGYIRAGCLSSSVRQLFVMLIEF